MRLAGVQHRHNKACKRLNIGDEAGTGPQQVERIIGMALGHARRQQKYGVTFFAPDFGGALIQRAFEIKRDEGSFPFDQIGNHKAFGFARGGRANDQQVRLLSVAHYDPVDLAEQEAAFHGKTGTCQFGWTQ